MVLALALLTTKLYVWISYAQRNFSTALSGKDVRKLAACTHTLRLLARHASCMARAVHKPLQVASAAWRIMLMLITARRLCRHLALPAMRNPDAVMARHVCPARCAAGFYAAVRQFVLIICVAAPLFSFTSWVEERLVLAWRAALTRYLAQAYFSHM